MTRRAALVDETRQRIVEATTRLHTTVGPANTSIAGIADEAGVTRLTIYRHFPELETLFEACRAHWMHEHEPPDPTAWRAIPDLEARAHRALGELYRWFDANGDELYPINRDATTMPPGAQERRRAQSAALAAALAGDEATERPDGPGRRTLLALAGHLVDYWTWRSLVVEQRLSTDEAVDLAVRILTGARVANSD